MECAFRELKEETGMMIRLSDIEDAPYVDLYNTDKDNLNPHKGDFCRYYIYLYKVEKPKKSKTDEEKLLRMRTYQKFVASLKKNLTRLKIHHQKVLKENITRMMRRKREKRHIHQRGRRKARSEIEIRAEIEIEMTAEIEITAKIEIEKGIETEKTKTEETDTEIEETETEIGIETEEIKRSQPKRNHLSSR